MQRLNFREYKYLEKFSKWLKLLFWFLQIYRNWFNLIWSYTSKLIKRKQKKKRRRIKKKKDEPPQPGRPNNERPTVAHPAERTERTLLLLLPSRTGLYVTSPWLCHFPSYFPQFYCLFFFDSNTKLGGNTV